MLLKAIPAAEQQALVTDRILTSPGIIFKLLIRFQPGVPGEKQLLLTQLTTFPKCKDVQEVAAGISNWRRHYGGHKRSKYHCLMGCPFSSRWTCHCSIWALWIPDSFSVESEPNAIGVGSKPHTSISGCSTSTSSTTPIKFKQLDGDLKSPNKSSNFNNGDGKSKQPPLESKPCRYFASDKGCKAGKSCKWMHAWESLPDKSERCWICGSKEHRKNDCRLKSSTAKRPGEPMGSGEELDKEEGERN